MQAREAVEITGIAAGGAGVGRLVDGRVVFVHRTAPGEVVEVRVTEAKRRWARAELVEIRNASADRREAPCPHYTRCGGCTLEHLQYEAQLRVKSAIVADALRRIGGIDVAAPPVVPSPQEFHYRNRLSFTLLRLAGGRVVAGFHELNRPNRVVDITAACLLPERPLGAAWRRLRSAWGETAERLPSGPRLRLTLRISADGMVALVVDGGHSRGRPDELIERIAELSAIWHRPANATEPVLVAGAGPLPETWGEDRLELQGPAFLQVNRSAAALLEAYVADLTGEVTELRVVDAYCGVGLLARRLARRGADVIGIELDPRAIAAARKGAPEKAHFVAGAVEELLSGALPADLVIVNPPRRGLHPAVPDALNGDPPGRLLYVSCNPATLARDLTRLTRFRLRSLKGFDLFPQTAHVETVAELAVAKRR